MRSALASRIGLLGVWLAGTFFATAVAPLAIAQSLPPNFVLHDTPRPIPTIRFEDDQGRSLGLADFKGKVVLMNIWATWCAPCRREMPSLDRLQGALGNADFALVALSIDRSGIEVVRKFYAALGIRNLAIYIDTSGKLPRELGVVGVPSTLFVGRDGMELGRLIGPAEWDAPEIVEFLKRTLSQKASEFSPPTKQSTEGGTA